MRKEHSTACPLDCWDQCSFKVISEDDRVVAIEPDQRQNVTGNFICRKGLRHLERLYHSDRLRQPLVKRDGRFIPTGWEESLDLMAEKIKETLNSYGTHALMHFYDGGNGGTVKSIESRFFSALGGVTKHTGGLCWSAGLAAQNYDFGAVRAHPFSDLKHAQTIIIWGRNPVVTSPHLLPFIRDARKKGAKVILIDPLRTASSTIADQHISIKPGTDGALALCLANIIIRNGWADSEFTTNKAVGFAQYEEAVEKCSPEAAAAITGIDEKTIIELSHTYVKNSPSAILLGFGLQRYTNGGNTIRAIDALAAVSGYIGVKGGGVSYANFRVSNYIDHDFLNGADLLPDNRYYPKPKLGASLLNFNEPPVRFLYISRSNPAVQVGNSNLVQKAISSVPFVVVAEHFLTDTARLADLILPCTTFLEEEDLYYTSMSHPYLNYSKQVVRPQGLCRNEFDYLKDLATRLKLSGFPMVSSRELLARAIKPLTSAFGLHLSDLEEGPVLLPGGDDIPWHDQLFAHGDEKYHFYSEQAYNDGHEPLPVFSFPNELAEKKDSENKDYPYWYVTPHTLSSIHSTHFLSSDHQEEPAVYLHPLTAKKEEINNGNQVVISSPRGKVKARVVIDSKVREDTVLIYQGWWLETGASVNVTTSDRISDMGDQAAYYDCLCRIEKV